MLGKGEEYALADYAATHWEKHKQPLRIAVDEACWRFCNLSDEQVVRIREGEPAANPIEKTILWRILNMWKMNIQLLFVTDGLKKPGKKRWVKKTGGGRGGGKVDKEVIKMLHKMFDRLHVPYHMALGEAEAECARLQQLGVVDAVWSDDGDCLMFGCTTLIKAHRNAQKKKEWDRIEIEYNAETILPRFDFDTDSLVMFAVLSDGDYDDKGLPACGPQTAKVLCQQRHGLARILRQCKSNHDFNAWQHLLEIAIQDLGFGISVPSDFPYVKTLNGYREPAVSTDDKCHNLRGLHVKDGGWDWWEGQMDQTKLRVVLRSHYNFQTREYLKHLGPVFLARALSRNVTPARREENLSYGVSLRRTQNRKGEDGEDIGQPAEVHIKFSPAMLVQINLAVQPSEEDWSSTIKGDGIPYDPLQAIDGAMMSCFLKHGLPEGALDKPAKSPAKRGKKLQANDAPDDADKGRAGPSASQQGPSSPRPTKRRTDVPADLEAIQVGPQASQPKATKKRKARSEVEDNSIKPVKRSRKSKTAEKTPSPSPPPATFKRLSLPNLVTKKTADHISKAKAIPASSLVIDLDDDSDDDELPGSMRASSSLPNPRSSRTHHDSMVNSMAPTAPIRTNDYAPSSQRSYPSAYGVAPLPLPPSSMAPPASSMERMGLQSSSPAGASERDGPPSAATLRQRREAGLLSKLAKTADLGDDKSQIPAAASIVPSKPRHEVIDLT